MPIIIFLRQMELPPEDRVKLRELTYRVVNPEGDGHRSVPLDELGAYLLPVVEERMEHPGDDAISHMAAQRMGERPFTLDELVKLTRTVLMGGLDTTAGMLGYFANYLAQSPEDRRKLSEHPELINKAVEEILRRFPIANIGRFVTRDVTYRGITMKAGDHILWPVGMYNFDPARYANPMKVEFERQKNQHASFGVGAHFCVGAPLARAELRIFAEEWLREFPDFAVKPGFKVKYRRGFTVTYESLPLVLNATASSQAAGNSPTNLRSHA
jgi:camphor 5-monooxygenase